MLVNCNTCGDDIITEGDTYVVFPVHDNEIDCGCYFERPLEKRVELAESVITQVERLLWVYKNQHPNSLKEQREEYRRDALKFRGIELKEL